MKNITSYYNSTYCNNNFSLSKTDAIKQNGMNASCLLAPIANEFTDLKDHVVNIER